MTPKPFRFLSPPVLACAPLLLIATSVLRAETLSEDTVWRGPVSVDEDVEVPAGVTLTIENGATIALADDVSILVRGRLQTHGTLAQPIRFTRQDGGGSWGRILFIDADDSQLLHCVIEFSDSEGDHKDYYDDKDENCDPVDDRPPRDYNEAVVVIASHVEIIGCTFQNLPDDSSGGEGDAIAVISDDPEVPGEATATIIGCQFLGIGQGVHTRYSYVLVEECFFTEHNGDNDDVDLYGESDPPPMIRNNLFIDPNHDDMINPTRCSAIIIGNVIAGSDDHGIVLRDRCDPVLINNFIYNCSSAGIAVQNTCDALLINNTIVDCGRGVRFFDHTGRWDLPYCLFPGSGSATLINTVVWDCNETFELANSPSDAQPGSHLMLIHCNIQDGDERMDVSSNSTVTRVEGNIDAAPLFVDPDSGDFRLQEDSPMIDAGTSEQAPEFDIHGVSRPCGNGVDIGATEYDNCDVTPVVEFLRGDPNVDGFVDIGDALTVLFHLFRGRSLDCQKAADADDNGILEIADAISVLQHLFLGAGPFPAPHDACGEDPTGDSLTCESHAACP